MSIDRISHLGWLLPLRPHSACHTGLCPSFPISALPSLMVFAKQGGVTVMSPGS